MVGIAHVFVENDGRELGLFFDSLVRNLLEHRNIVDGLHGEGHLLLDGSAFRVSAGEGHVGSAVPVRIRNFDGSGAGFVDVHIERAPFRFLALVLHVGFPGEFGILVVGILHVFVELDLGEGLLFVDGLVRNLLHEFRLVVHGVHGERSFGFGTSASRVTNLELDRFGAVPEFVRNNDSCGLAIDVDLEVLVAGNGPLELFELVVRVLDESAEIDGLEFLLFVDRLVLDVLDELRRIVDGLHGKGRTGLRGRTGRVGHGKGESFRTVPELVRDLDACGAILVDIDLQVLVARHGPLERGHVVINVGNEVGQADLFELVLFFDGLAGDLLENRSIVDRLDREGRRLLVARVFAVGRGEGNLGRTVPVGIGDDDGRDTLRVDLHIEVAVSLILAHRLDVEFPEDLVLRVVGVGHEIVELDLRELLTFVDGLVRNRGHGRRVVDRFNGEGHRLGTDSSLRVGSGERDVFFAIPVLVRNSHRGNSVVGNAHLEALVARDGPLELGGLVHVVGNIAVQLNRSELAAFLDGFTRNAIYHGRIVFNRCGPILILSDNCSRKDARGGNKRRNCPIHSFHL